MLGYGLRGKKKARNVVYMGSYDIDNRETERIAPNGDYEWLYGITEVGLYIPKGLGVLERVALKRIVDRMVVEGDFDPISSISLGKSGFSLDTYYESDRIVIKGLNEEYKEPEYLWLSPIDKYR